MRLLLDEMYSSELADALRAKGIDATTVIEQRLAGTSDTEVFAFAQAIKHAVLTENVADFTRLAADHSSAGRRHHGLVIALSTRFSRQAAGATALVAAVQAIAHEEVDDRVVYLKAAD